MRRRGFIISSGLSLAAFGGLAGISSALDISGNDSLQIDELTRGLKALAPEDYVKRQEKAKQLMEQNGIDGLLLTGGTNMSYFLDMSWWRSERFFGAILNTKGDPVWICPAFEEKRAREMIQFGSDIRTWEENESPYKLVACIMKDLGAPRGKLAIGPTVRNFVVEGIQADGKGRKLRLADGSVITNGCRGIKTKKELKFMDVANRITKLSYAEGFRHLKEGMSSADLAKIISETHSSLGAKGGSYPQFGTISAFPHGSKEDPPLREGDIVLNDGGCSVQGYRSDVTRTVIFGKPSDRQKRVFDIVLKAQQEAFKAIRPGVTAESVDAVARKVIEDAGFGPGYKYFAHRLGHGIGMDGHEYPYLVGGNKLKLEPGMTFSNEPGIYIYGEFGVRIEDCFVVTEDGARYLGGMTTRSIDDPFGAT